MTDSPPYPNFIGAAEQETLDNSLTHIVRSLINRNVQFLFGRGMSDMAQIPSEDELIRKLIVSYFSPTNDGAWSDTGDNLALDMPLSSALEAFSHLPGTTREDLTDKLKEFVAQNPACPSKAHTDFLSLLWGEKGIPRLPLLLTTNFDDLLEQTLGEDRAVTITRKNLRNLGKEQKQGKIPVIHLLGTLDDDGQLTELDAFQEKNRLLFYELESALHLYESFIFVGFSHSDSAFWQIYSMYRSRITSRGEINKRTFVVSPVADPYKYSLWRSLWHSRGLTWIPLDSADFFAKLRHLAKTRADEEIRTAIMRKYSLAERTSVDEYIHRVADLLRMSEADGTQFLNETLPRGGGK